MASIPLSNYEHDSKNYHLNDLHQAMQYNASGEPQVRVHVDGISLEGDVIVDRVKLWDGTSDLIFDMPNNDGETAPISLPTENHNMVFNGSTWDRMRGNIADGVLTQISNDYLAISKDTNANAEGNPIYVNVTNGSLTISGSVSISSLPEVEIKNDIDNPIPISKNTTANSSSNPIDVTGSVDATINGEVSVAGMNPDAFGRQRVSELFTLGDYKHLYAIDPNFLDSVSNGGTVTFDANQACAILATSSNTNSVAIHQTKFYHHYQPGKSQLIYSSVNFRAPHRNVTKRTGYFDYRDGIYFEQVGSNTADGSTVSPTTQTLNWVIRTYVGGSPNESDYVTTINGTPYTYKRRVPQTEWNRDRCDGTGGANNPSGFKLDVTKTQLAWIDFQWLGVGRVRCGFVHNGELITAHEYYHSNVLPTVYMSNPNLPVRCEIRNTGTTPGGEMNQICSSVMSEGGYIESGIDWSVYSTERATPTPGRTKLPVIAIRLKNSFQGYPNRLSVRPLTLSLFARTEPIVFEVVKLRSVADLSTALNGGVLTWTSADSDSGVEYCTNATAYVEANADRFASGYVPAGSSQNSLSPVSTGTLTSAKKNIISQNIDSTGSEIFVVVASTVFAGNNLTADVACSIQWREIY